MLNAHPRPLRNSAHMFKDKSGAFQTIALFEVTVSKKKDYTLLARIQRRYLFPINNSKKKGLSYVLWLDKNRGIKTEGAKADICVK